MRLSLIYPSVGRKDNKPYVRAWQMQPLSMALLAATCLGIPISALTLGEGIGISLIVGALLIGSGIRLATLAAAPGPKPDRPSRAQMASSRL